MPHLRAGSRHVFSVAGAGSKQATTVYTEVTAFNSEGTKTKAKQRQSKGKDNAKGHGSSKRK